MNYKYDIHHLDQSLKTSHHTMIFMTYFRNNERCYWLAAPVGK